MEKGLFRKKSIERISSPEELHNYMRVTTPRLWMILGAIVALLVGFIVYASTATMENTMPISVSLTHYEIPAEDTASGETEKLTGMVAFLPHAMKDQVDLGISALSSTMARLKSATTRWKMPSGLLLSAERIGFSATPRTVPMPA